MCIYIYIYTCTIYTHCNVSPFASVSLYIPLPLYTHRTGHRHRFGSTCTWDHMIYFTKEAVFFTKTRVLLCQVRVPPKRFQGHPISQNNMHFSARRIPHYPRLVVMIMMIVITHVMIIINDNGHEDVLVRVTENRETFNRFEALCIDEYIDTYQ